MNQLKKKLKVVALIGMALVAGDIYAQGDWRAEKKIVRLATGVTMSYVERGKQGGLPVVLLHGLSDTSKSYKQTIDAMLTEDPELHVFAFDLRGHGDTTLPDPEPCAESPQFCFRMRDFANDIIAAMDNLKLDRVHMVGHSLGSFVTQEIALLFPDRLYSITLIGSAVATNTNPALVEFISNETVRGQWRKAFRKNVKGTWPKDVYLLTPSDVDPFADRWMKENWVVEPTAEPDFLESIFTDTRKIPLGTWVGTSEMLREWDNRDRIKSLRVPTLVLWSTQDSMFPKTPDQDLLLSSLKAASERDLPRYFFKVYGKEPLPESGFTENDYGHNTHWGAPLAVASDLVSFFRAGVPTNDFPYADKADCRVERKDADSAQILSSAKLK